MARSSVSFQILPLMSAPRKDVYGLIDKVIALIDEAGVRYEVGPMETTMDGELDVLLDIVQRAHRLCHREGVDTVLSVVKVVTSGKGDVASIDEKVAKYRARGH